MTTPEPRKSGLLELPRGTAIGKYEILRKLATGGMAEIYLARVSGTAGFEKLVVLKRILPTIAEDPKLVQMFLEEARLAATLRHPNIADVYDVGEDDGIVFFTMEFVHGQDVRTIRQDAKRQQAPVPMGVGLAIVHATASALEHAHELTGADGKSIGLVHRDVSTSNIMVSYDGAIKLLDFGIARATSSTHKTQTGTLKGKVAYMSPEQCKGTPLDRRSDLFSLGVVMYELTVGRRPFRGDTDFAIMDQIVYQGAPKPSSLWPQYPPELEAIVMKLLERDATKRYPTSEDLLHDIDDYVGKQGLWQSPRAIGKFMRSLFAEKIVAWEQAEQQGVPFAQHVAHSITSQSQRVELMTPSVSFPGVEPRPSQRHLLETAATVKQPALEKPEPEPVPLPVAKLESEPVSYPSIRPSRGLGFLRVVLALLVLGGAGAAGFYVMQNQQELAPTPTAEDPAPEQKPAVTETKTDPTKADEAKGEAAKLEASKAEASKAEASKVEASKVEETKAEQAKAKTEEAKAKVEQAKAEQAKAEQAKAEAKAEEAKAKAEQAKAKAEQAKAEQAKAEAAKAEAAKIAKANKRTPVKSPKKTPKADPTKADPTKTETKVETKTPPKQDPNKPFDPDSPFLPQ